MSSLSTHVLDTARGQPAAELPLALYREIAGAWQELATGVTNDDGRVPALLEGAAALVPGQYRMHFATATYFERLGGSVFYPWVDVVFRIDAVGEHYHIPLLLSPFGYSTYRGS